MSPTQILIVVLVAVLAFVAGALVFHGIGRRQGRADAEPALVGLQRDATTAREQAGQLHQRCTDLELAAAAERQQLQRVSEERSAMAARTERLSACEAQLSDTRAELERVRASRAEAEAKIADLQARQEEQLRAQDEKLQALLQSETRLTEAFQNLATRILDERASKFGEQSQQQVGGLLAPLRDQIKEFREAIDRSKADEQQQRGMLREQIQTLRQLNERISQDAINLTRALKGDSQAQGAWGEMVLERVLEASGLQAGREFEVQASYVDDEGGRPRPDVVVHLPEEKDLVIDAKVSLVAYERCVAAEDDVARALALREHVASLKRHIDGLAARGYTELPGLKTLDFVLMFVPVEAAFIEAVRADDGLYAYALGKNISIVSPSTLLATLRTVAYLWRIERRNVNAMEIARRGALLHDNFVLLVGELENAGSQLDKARNAQASALRRLTEGGKGSVILQVQSLAEMGTPVRKKLPSNLLDVAGAASGDEGEAGGDEAGE